MIAESAYETEFIAIVARSVFPHGTRGGEEWEREAVSRMLDAINFLKRGRDRHPEDIAPCRAEVRRVFEAVLRSTGL